MDSQKNYLEYYDKYFKSLTDEKVTLLELGIWKGDSLKFWRDYFKNGLIVGIDINKVIVDDPSGRINIYQGSQYDISFLNSVSNKYGKYDIIIDDASHIGEFTKISFWHLFNNYLKPGGIYVIEDWGTGYYSNFPDGKVYKLKQNHIRNSLQLKIDNLMKPIEIKMGHKSFTEKLKLKLLRKIRMMSLKRKFKSHNFGLVGFIKELIDEMGLDIITSEKGNQKITEQRKFLNLEIFPGQVFITKRLDHLS